MKESLKARTWRLNLVGTRSQSTYELDLQRRKLAPLIPKTAYDWSEKADE